MNTQLRIGLVVALLSLAVSPSIAASISLMIKEPGSSSNKYTYSYTCSNGTKGTISVSSTNDSAAQKLADAKARRVCEELY